MMTTKTLGLNTAIIFIGLLCTDLAASEVAFAEDVDWSDPMSIDHAGFSNGTGIVSKGRYQIESGIDFSADSMSTNWVSRYGFNDWIEFRFAVPSISATYEHPGLYVVDSLVAGPKIRLLNGDRIQFAVLPYLIFPTGIDGGSADGLSLGMEVLTDVTLTDSMAISLSIYPRLLRKFDAPNDKYDTGGDSSFAFAFAYSLTKELSVCIDAWATMTESAGSDGFDFTPGADLAITYLFTPNVAVDIYTGANKGDTETTPFGGFGVSIRL